jgi:hypothetical protein
MLQTQLQTRLLSLQAQNRPLLSALKTRQLPLPTEIQVVAMAPANRLLLLHLKSRLLPLLE